MRLPHTVAGVLAGLLAASCAVADPSRPLAADDPAQGSGWATAAVADRRRQILRAGRSQGLAEVRWRERR